MQQEQSNEVTKVTKPNHHIQLDEWLERVNATTVWSKSIREDLCAECYRIGNSLAIVLRYDRGAWDIFTSGDKIMIPAMLRDAERRLGINLAEMSNCFEVKAVTDPEPKCVEFGIVGSGDERFVLMPDAAEAFGLALVAAADSARDPRNGT